MRLSSVIDGAVECGHAVAVAHRGKGAGDGGRRRAGLVGNAHDQRRAAAVDHRVAELGGDDFPAQPVARQRVGELRGDLLREIAADLAAEIGIVGHRRFEQIVIEREFRHRRAEPTVRAG